MLEQVTEAKSRDGKQLPEEKSAEDQLTELISHRFAYLLHHNECVLRDMTSDSLAALGLTPMQLGMLEFIATSEPVNQRTIGEHCGIDRTTIVSMIDNFEKQGYATRNPDPNDRRNHAVCVTERGREILKEAEARWRSAQDEFLAPLSQPERETLRLTLLKLIRHNEDQGRQATCPSSNQ